MDISASYKSINIRFTRSEEPHFSAYMIANCWRIDNHPTNPHCTIMHVSTNELMEWADRTDSWGADNLALQKLFELMSDDPEIQEFVIYMDHPDQHNQDCDCINQINELLKKDNTELDTTLTLSKKYTPVMATVNTMKIDTAKRGKPVRLTASHCPFCGKSYKRD